MTISESAARYHPWSTYVAVREEAHRFGDRKIGTDHLVLGLLRDPEIEKILGVSLSTARAKLGALDVASLEAIGLVPAPKTPYVKSAHFHNDRRLARCSGRGSG